MCLYLHLWKSSRFYSHRHRQWRKHVMDNLAECVSSPLEQYRVVGKILLLVVQQTHYNDVILGTMASKITSLTIIYSSVYSGADQRKHQSSASLAFVRGTHRWPVNSPHKGPVTRKMFPFDDVIVVFVIVTSSFVQAGHHVRSITKRQCGSCRPKQVELCLLWRIYRHQHVPVHAHKAIGMLQSIELLRSGNKQYLSDGRWRQGQVSTYINAVGQVIFCRLRIFTQHVGCHQSSIEDWKHAQIKINFPSSFRLHYSPNMQWLCMPWYSLVEEARCQITATQTVTI